MNPISVWETAHCCAAISVDFNEDGSTIVAFGSNEYPRSQQIESADAREAAALFTEIADYLESLDK